MSDFDPQAERALPSDPVLTRAESDSEDYDVDAAVQGLAGLVSDVDDLEAVLTRIADLALAAVPGADGVGVTLNRAGVEAPTVLSWAATDPFVHEIDHLQYDICQEGPCLTAMQTGRGVISGSLGSDRRWPRFGGRVARMKVHSALSVPLSAGGAVVGVLNVYARERDTFTEHALRLAEQFGVPAGVSVSNIQTLHATHMRARQLQTALTSRAIIDQAIGILRSRTGGDEREAFDRLRAYSQADGVKLAVVAERIVDEAVRRAHARNAPQVQDPT